jgi:CheY-like chemotaxis protein
MLERVLIIEDNNEDFQSILRALGDHSAQVTITRCLDGDDALDLLQACPPGEESSVLPSLILLDLNLPGTDGREILAEFKRDERLKVIPVVVLSTSDNAKDIVSCYRLGASAYCRKPIDRARFDETVRAIGAFWFRLVALPRFVTSA